MELNSIVLLAQWGIILLFVLFHFFLGFKRGTTKSLYYFIVSLIMTVVTLFIVSMFTIRWFYTPTSLIAQVKGLWEAFPTEYEAYLSDPGVGAVIFALVDLVVKIVAFFILYPIVKYALTLIFFKMIWTRLIEPRLQKNVKGKKRVVLVNGHAKSYDLVPVGQRSGKKKKLSSRFIGGGIGAVRGVIVAFIFLLPIMVLSSMVSPVETSSTAATGSTSATPYADTTGENAEMVNDLLDALRDFNELGLGAFARQFKVNEQNLDKYIFDKVFTTKIKENGKTTDLNLADEVEAFVGVGRFLIDRGILDNSFDYEDISKEDLEDIRGMLDGVQRSRLVDAVIPIATRVLITEYLSDELEFDFYGSEDSKRALDAFDQINWDEEFDRIYDVLEVALNFASVKDLLVYADNPKALLELTPEQGALVADAIDALSKLEMLVLANAGVDYARSNEMVLDFIDWLPEEERQDYINNRSAFMTEDLKYLQNQIGKLSDVVRAVFSEEYSGDLDLTYIVDNISNLDVLLSDDPVYSAWVNEVLLAVIDLDLVIQAMPIAADYSIYTFLGEDFEETLVDKLATELDGTAWKGELTNIADVYRQVLSLGIKGLFADDVEMIDAVDALLEEMAKSEEGLTAIKEITTAIFDGSDAINRALEILAPALVDKFVDDEDLATLIKDGLGVNPTSGETNFNYGKEVNDVLSVVEVFYQFASIGTFTNQTLGANEMVDVLAGFGGLSTQQFNTMVTKLTNLQMVTRLNGDILSYVKEAMSLDFLYVPGQVELKKDLTTILNVAYEAGKFANQEVEAGKELEDIDFTPLLSNDNFRSYLTITNQNRHSNLLMANIAYNLMDLAQNEQVLIDYVEIPADLMNKNPESAEWESELNRLINGAFNLGVEVGANPNITLSINGIKEIADEPTALPASLVTQFKDQALTSRAFGQLESSFIFRASVPKVVNNFSDALDELIPGYVLSLPEVTTDENGLKVGVLSELITNTAAVIDELNQQLAFQTIEDALDVKEIDEYLSAFNTINAQTLDAFGRMAILEGIVGEALVNPVVIDYIYDQLSSIELPVDVITGSLRFDAAYTNGVLNAGEISKLLLGALALQVPSALVTDFSVDVLLDYVKTINDETIDAVFGSKLLHQVITNVVDHPNLETYVIDLANEEFDKIVAQEEMLEGLTLDFEALFAVVTSIKDDNGLFDHVEIKNLLNAFNALDISSLDELTNFELRMITDYYYNEVDGKNVYYHVSGSYVLRGVITTLLQDNGVLSWAYDLAEEELNPILVDFDMVLSDVLLKSDLTGLEIDPQYLDQKGYLEQADFYDLMVAAASLKIHELIVEGQEITTNDIIAYVYSLNNQSFSNDSKDALGFIYRSRYVRALLQNVIENEETEIAVLDLLNEQLANVSDQLDYSFRQLNSNDLNLSYDLIDEDAMRSLISAVENAGIYSVDQLTTIKTISDVTSLIRLDQSDDILVSLIDTPLVKFVLNTVLVSDLWSSFVTDLVNDLLVDVDLVDITLDEELFMLDQRLFTDGVIDTVHIVDLVKALYATGYDVDAELNPEFVAQMVEQTMVAGEMVVRVDQVLNSEVLFTYIDKLFADMTIKQALADLIMDQAQAQGFDLEIDYKLLNAPKEALDENGRLKKTEITSLLNAFVSLELVSWNDFDQFSDLSFISKKVNETMVVDHLLASDWLYYVIGGLLASPDNRESLAEALTTVLNDELGISYQVKAQTFMFAEFKYDLVSIDEDYYGYFKREEIKQLIKSGLRIDYTSLSFNTTDDIFYLIDLLLEEGNDNVKNIDYIFSSNILVALFDKLLNTEGNPALDLNVLYAELANKYLPEISSELVGLQVTENLFDFNHISDAKGVFEVKHLISILEFAQVIDLDNLNVQFAFDLFDKDMNFNGSKDIDDLFESKIVHSLLTNVLVDTGVRSFAVNFINDLISDQNIEVLNDLSLDVEEFLVAISEVNDENGLFDYQQFVRVRNVLKALNINSQDDFENVDVNSLTTLSNMTIEGSNYLSYIAHTNLVRYLIDAALKQDGLYEFASDFIFDEFQIFYSPSDLRIEGYEDTNGRLSVKATAEILFAASAIEFKPIMDQMVTPAFLVNLLEKQNANVTKDRLGLIFGSEVINGLIEKLANHESTSQKLADLINEQVPSFATSLGVDIRVITKEDLAISYELVNEASLRSLIVAFNKLGISQFEDMQQLKNIKAYADLFDVETSSDLLVEALNTPIVLHMLNQVLLSDIWTTLVADLVNTKVLNNYNQEVDASLFEINRDLFVYNERLLAVDIAELLLSAYAVGFDVDKAFDVNTIASWEAPMLLDGETKARFYQVLDSGIIYDYINRLVKSEDVMSIVAYVIETEAAKLDFNVSIDETKMEIPSYLLDNTNRFKKDELMNYVVLFNSLDLDGFGDLSNQKLMYSKIHSTDAVEKLFDTELAYNLVLETHANDELLQNAANEINELAQEQLGISPNLSKEFFLFNDVKYNLYDQGLLKREELVQLVLSLTRVDWLDVDLGNPQAIITALNDEKEFTTNIDYMMQSNILVAIFDKVLNFNEHSVVANFAVNYINKFASENADFADLTVTASLFNIHPDAVDANGVLKASEVIAIVRAASLIDWSIQVDFNSFANLVGQNVNNNVYDDFDELLVSKVVHSLISNALTNSNVIDYLVSKANEIQTTFTATSDLFAFDPSVMNGTLVKVSELRNAVVAVDTIGLDTLTGGQAVNLDTFTDLVGRNLVGSKDDLDRVLDSGILYVILTKVFEMDELDTLANEQLTQVLVKVVDTFDVSAPVDALGTSGIELNRFSKAEIRNLMVSLSLLNIGTDLSSVSPDMLTGLIGQNVVGTKDDLDRVLESKYLVDKLDLLLQAPGFIDLLANDLFDPNLFNIPSVATETVGTRQRLTALELRKLFVALDVLGITDFANPNVGVSTLTGLTQTQLDQVLESTYLYAFVDLVLKGQTDITIPADALETSGNFDGMIKVTEITSLFDALGVLGVTDVADVTVDTVTVAKLQELHDLNSSVIDQIISDEIENALTSVPTVSYAGTRIARTEVQSLIDALGIINVASLADDISVDSITTAKLQELHALDSDIINRLLSEGIIDSVGRANIRDDAFSATSEEDELNNKLDLDYLEVGRIILALGDLNVNLTTGINPASLTPSVIKTAVSRDSIIVNRLVSKEVIAKVSSVPTSSYEVGSSLDIRKPELINVLDALIALNADLSAPIDVDAINHTTFNSLLALNSRLVDRLISKSILDSTIDVPASALAVSGDIEFDSNAVGSDILRSELTKLSNTMETLNISLTDGVDPNAVTRANLNVLVNYNSRIIDRIISERVIEIVVDVPTSSYVDNDQLDITNAELKKLVQTLGILGVNNLSAGIDTTSLTQGQLDDLYNLDSRLVDRMISKELIASTAITVPTEAISVLGDSNFDSNHPGKDIKRSELSALINAMGIMNVSNITVSMDAQTITIAQLQQLDALNSSIVDRILSSAIISA